MGPLGGWVIKIPNSFGVGDYRRSPLEVAFRGRAVSFGFLYSFHCGTGFHAPRDDFYSYPNCITEKENVNRYSG